MSVEVKIIKDIPKKDINRFEDLVVYNSAVLTREYTKGKNAFPYLTGKLQRTEIASKITGSDKEYNLLAGTNYAKRVWNMTNVKWTNPSTKPRWYYNTYKQKESVIISEATKKAMKEIK